MSEVFNHTIEPDFKAYLSLPKHGTGPFPGLLLLHEVYGVNDSLKAIADEYADKGFIVMCPNMYWHHNPDASFRPQAPGEEMTVDLERQRDAARDLMYNKFDNDLAIEDMEQAATALRDNLLCDGNVAAMGFCLGAKNTYLAMLNGVVDAGVAFYPTPDLQSVFSEKKTAAIQSPLLFIYGGKDPYIAPEEKGAMQLAARDFFRYAAGDTKPTHVEHPNGNPNIVTLDYNHHGHAFSRVGGRDFDPLIADHVNTLAVAFLKAALSPADGGLKAAHKLPADVLWTTPQGSIYLPAPKK